MMKKVWSWTWFVAALVVMVSGLVVLDSAWAKNDKEKKNKNKTNDSAGTSISEGDFIDPEQLVWDIEDNSISEPGDSTSISEGDFIDPLDLVWDIEGNSISEVILDPRTGAIIESGVVMRVEDDTIRNAQGKKTCLAEWIDGLATLRPHHVSLVTPNIDVGNLPFRVSVDEGPPKVIEDRTGQPICTFYDNNEFEMCDAEGCTEYQFDAPLLQPLTQNSMNMLTLCALVAGECQ
jgi:hypothetical protein